MCQCATCQQGREFQSRLALLPADQRLFFETLYGHLADVQMDCDYANAILSGTWPQAVEILEQALTRAKGLRAKTEAAEALG